MFSFLNTSQDKWNILDYGPKSNMLTCVSLSTEYPEFSDRVQGGGAVYVYDGLLPVGTKGNTTADDGGRPS